MKYILIITLCSYVDLTCIPSVQMPGEYNDLYECFLDGYDKSYMKIEEIGRDDINKFKIFTKFRCDPVNTI